MPTLDDSSASSFDREASRYDARVGLPASVGAAVAQAIADLAGARADDVVVELGAGTGAIGIHLARLPLRYIGLDASAEMLEVFRGKAASSTPSLIVADCNRAWPLPDGRATVVFASRVVHLLEPDHVARETIRICRPVGWLILGRVVRDREGITERLNRQRRQLLARAGVVARQGESGTRRVIESCIALGGISHGRQIVAEWSVATTPATVIAGWEPMSRMGSVAVDAATRAGILDELRDWARIEFGDLDRQETFRDGYAVDVIQLP